MQPAGRQAELQGARRNGHVYLDYATAVGDAAGAFKADLNGDGLHPNAAGYALMAPLAEKAIADALRAPVRTVRSGGPGRPAAPRGVRSCCRRRRRGRR